MVNFNEIEYERINYDETKTIIEKLIEDLNNSQNYEKFEEVVKKINDIHCHIEQMYDYADIRNMRDSKDEYYNDEINYWNEYKPKLDLLFKPFYEICLNSQYREKLSRVVPSNFFNTLEYQLRITSDEIIDLQKQENELKSSYRKVVAKKIIFDNEEHNISYLIRFFSDPDRSVRKKAQDAYNDFYYENQEELDNIFYNLINVRNEIAKKLGFKDYSEFSLYSLRRFGYNYSDIKNFRDNIIKYIIPICKKISDWQKEELGLEELEYFDTIFYKEMPKLKYMGQDLLDAFKDIFNILDSKVSELYSQMLENGYIDLLNRDNKVNFAITNYLTEFGYPVITGNFKGSYLDVQVTAHEFGHSYQKYNASLEDKKYIISPLLKYPTFDIAEMFSYAMELISLEHIKKLFSEEDYKKYCFLKMKDLISSLPYIALVDEFQETIYSMPELKITDMREVWLKLATKYGLIVNNKGHINLDTGGYFYRQNHIFLNPFYYIDYGISYFGAFALWQECREDMTSFDKMGAVASYYPLLELIKMNNIPSPFEEESVKAVSNFLEKELVKRR